MLHIHYFWLQTFDFKSNTTKASSDNFSTADKLIRTNSKLNLNTIPGCAANCCTYFFKDIACLIRLPWVTIVPRKNKMEIVYPTLMLHQEYRTNIENSISNTKAELELAGRNPQFAIFKLKCCVCESFYRGNLKNVTLIFLSIVCITKFYSGWCNKITINKGMWKMAYNASRPQLQRDFLLRSQRFFAHWLFIIQIMQSSYPIPFRQIECVSIRQTSY